MLKKYLFYLFSLLIISIASLTIIINNYNPYQINNVIYVAFYTSFFIFIFSLLAIVIFYLKIYIFKNSLIYTLFAPSLRQSFIASAGATVLLILQGMRLLDVWVGIPLAIVVVLIELFFQTKRKNYES